MNGGLIDYQAAVVGFAVAFLLAVLLTPVVSQLAWMTGIVDRSVDERRMHQRPTPLLGGLAILGAIVIPSAALGHSHGFWGIIAGAALMCALGALDDIRPLHPGAKMLGIVLIACIPAALGVTIDHVTLPLVGAFDLGVWQYPVTVFWIVAIVNIVNFNPATIFMGDSGSLMLGYLLAALAIQGVLKTAAAVSLVFPLMVLALPILDTSFVILKRLKHGQPIYQADRWHFHHRFANIGFSQRRTALYLYGWCCILSALALAIRFVPNHRHDWSPVAIGVLVGLGLLAVCTSVYVIYLLEILKARHLRAIGLLRTRGGEDVPQSKRAA